MLISSIAVMLLAAPVLEPITPSAAPSTAFYLTSLPKIDETPVHLRILSGYMPLTRGAGEDLHLIYSNLLLTTPLGANTALDAAILSRSLIGDALASVPSRLMFRLRYVPNWLDSEFVQLGFIAGGTFGADLKWDEPGQGVGAASAGVLLGGSLYGLKWGAQAGFGWGSTRLPGYGRSQELPLDLAVSTSLPLRWLNVALEGGASADLQRPRAAWDLLGLASLQVPFTLSTHLEIGATAVRTGSGNVVFGGLIAISGRLGVQDLDEDRVQNEYDACPGEPGNPSYQGCPFVDQDADGVWDQLDACPEQRGEERNAGCPLTDTDGDGVSDIDDPCPNTVECP